ncbi:soluble lytic murein transglycosylase [Paenibacillus shirakamiensis]|uniref:Soluble lytic murein transglycosylase n=1 Tax=Paenibacillus shirakamiensis TaxID=1265935 RepID=A0ABS4JLC3_9BACL|nr:lytic transglycosylase domain-containing protein [Paenibacillus shirakamiensis]MBP2002517.1 soluble lytic murein transglycosylase [Paenibacillus shirakamiensis]
MKWLRKKRVLLVLFLSFLVLIFVNTQWLTLFYPIHYKDEIRHHAETNKVDPFLVAAIIRVETNYKASQESPKGALGLMQIMPDTAKWIIGKANLPDISLDTLKREPDRNIQLGTWYLKSLYSQFNNNEIAVIAAYNAGPGKVKGWLKSGTWDGRLDTVKNIPIGETRHYVQRVSHYYQQYVDIYKEF